MKLFVYLGYENICEMQEYGTTSSITKPNMVSKYNRGLLAHILHTGATVHLWRATVHLWRATVHP